MNKNKKLLISGSAVAGAAIIGIGAYAYFNDSETILQTAKIGTVDISATTALTHHQFNTSGEAPGGITDVTDFIETAQDNINPGDNDPTTDPNYRPGTDHEIEINISNDGTKSVITRVLVEVSGKYSDDEGEHEIPVEDLQNVKLYYDKGNGPSGMSAIHQAVVTNMMYELHQMTDDSNENKIIYAIGGDFDAILSDDSSILPEGIETETNNMFRPTEKIIASGFVLSGSEEKETYTAFDQDLEAPTSGRFKLDIGLMHTIDNTSPLHGAQLKFKVIVQGMQYRNTGSSDWEDIFEQEYIQNIG